MEQLPTPLVITRLAENCLLRFGISRYGLPRLAIACLHQPHRGKNGEKEKKNITR